MYGHDILINRPIYGDGERLELTYSLLNHIMRGYYGEMNVFARIVLYVYPELRGVFLCVIGRKRYNIDSKT